jgi:hypothetical protein
MNSEQIQESIYQWACSKNFTAPYGVLTGEHTNKKGMKYRSVTFGRARKLDATVDIYNRNFMVVRTNVHGSQAFKTVPEMQKFLDTL